MQQQYIEFINQMVEELQNPVEPAEFCRRWLKMDNVANRNTIDRKIAEILNVTESTVRDWGEAPDYPKMPRVHRENLMHYHKRLESYENNL